MRLSAPFGRLERLKAATPEESTFTVASRVLPLKKLTLPSGEPVGTGATVAVRVTDCPAVAGFGKAVSAVAVEVGIALTVSVTTVDVEVV